MRIAVAGLLLVVLLVPAARSQEPLPCGCAPPPPVSFEYNPGTWARGIPPGFTPTVWGQGYPPGFTPTLWGRAHFAPCYGQGMPGELTTPYPGGMPAAPEPSPLPSPRPIERIPSPETAPPKTGPAAD
jgi:hypothetical protein